MKVTVNKLLESLVHLPELIIIFFSPARLQVCLVILAVLCDTVTGIWSAKRNQESICSKRFYDVAPKLIVYISLILLAHGIEVIFEINHARTLIAVGLTAIELMSIDENFKKATGKSIFKPILNLMKRK